MSNSSIYPPPMYGDIKRNAGFWPANWPCPALGLEPTGDHYVGKPSDTGQPYANSAFHPSGVDKWV